MGTNKQKVAPRGKTRSRHRCSSSVHTIALKGLDVARQVLSMPPRKHEVGEKKLCRDVPATIRGISIYFCVLLLDGSAKMDV